jgi:hypothetical protein
MRAIDACMAGRVASAPAARTAFNRAARKLAKGRAPKLVPETASLAPLVAAFSDASQAAAAARSRVNPAVAAAQEREARALAQALRDPRFREAVVWQNRAVLRGSLLPLLEQQDAPRNVRRRGQERLALSYVQRYAARNESIGFFGPVGWGEFTDSGPAIRLEPGPRLVADRIVEFEPWVIHELAAILSRPARLRIWYPPRLNPFLRLEDGRLFDAAGTGHTIVPAVARLLAACDGRTSAHDIAAALAADPESGFESEARVYAALAQLARRGTIFWRLELPVGFHPEVALGEAVARIGDTALRGQVAAPLADLVAARDRIAAARTPETLDAAFSDLESRFVRLVGNAAAARAGKRRVGRALAYEDCRRDVSFALGPEVTAELAAPLALVLASARWFAGFAGKQAMTAIQDVFSGLRTKSGGAVNFAPLWREALRAGAFSDRHLGVVRSELHARWAKLLPFSPDQRRFERTAASLASGVAAAFPAPKIAPKTALPRLIHHSPDIMIAAKSAEAIARGDYRFVLGEVHAGISTQMQAFLLRLHPHYEELVKAREDDLGRPEFMITWEHPSRHAPYSFSEDVYELACNAGPPRRPGPRALAISDLVAEKTEEGITVRTRDGRQRFHVFDVLKYYLFAWVSPRFSLLPDAPHTPRIAVDRLVLKRETWRFPAKDASFAGEKTETERFLAARRFAAAHGFPRRVFIRFPQETKPIYVDWESPGFVELAAHLWRAAHKDHREGFVTVVEMLPGPEDAWLVDAQGNRYTSELRITAVESRV